ncbi:MAG: hypothetical protein IK076_04735 [Bacteroidales bacterium]|nr:hypothetical protein [Bacteroidales bacterium]
MDIDLFSDIVRNLILDNDEVALPGLGTFVSEVMPSTFSDKGYTINPPYRRVSFRQRWNEADNLLVDFYSKSNGISAEDSRTILSEFITGLKETLQTRKAVQLPGLGRLRATKENTFFFIADEDLDIYPYGFGLRPVSLKTHQETPEEVSAAVQELQEIIQPEKEPRRIKPLKVILYVLLGVLVALAAFVLLSRLAPGFTDSLLYTEEELRIINY